MRECYEYKYIASETLEEIEQSVNILARQGWKTTRFNTCLDNTVHYSVEMRRELHFYTIRACKRTEQQIGYSHLPTGKRYLVYELASL